MWKWDWCRASTGRWMAALWRQTVSTTDSALRSLKRPNFARSVGEETDIVAKEMFTWRTGRGQRVKKARP